MIVLGIDPGIARTGWGVIEVNGSKVKALGYGCFETASKEDLPIRLEKLYKEISRLIKAYKPKVLGIEELFFNTNAKTAFVVGQARGVVLLCAAQSGIEVRGFTPLEVKMALTGYGRAEKTQIGKMVKATLNLKEIPKPDDTTDALAIALSCAFSKSFK